MLMTEWKDTYVLLQQMCADFIFSVILFKYHCDLLLWESEYFHKISLYAPQS